ncbi:MAG: hypothetical protein MZV65_25705 [Chromatiales bacterium]|nr:hypothetical protein [Chromatiales bacterium]
MRRLTSIALPAAATLAAAAETMQQHNIRSVVVRSEDGRYRLVLAGNLLSCQVRGLAALDDARSGSRLSEAETLDPDDSVLEGLKAQSRQSLRAPVPDRSRRGRGRASSATAIWPPAWTPKSWPKLRVWSEFDPWHPAPGLGPEPLQSFGTWSRAMDAGRFQRPRSPSIEGQPTGILTQRDLIELIDEGADLSAPMQTRHEPSAVHAR